MSIMSAIREAKGKIKQRIKERKAERAVYSEHPELELKDLKEKRKALAVQHQIREERAALRQDRASGFKERFGAVVSAVSGPTQKAVGNRKAGRAMARNAAKQGAPQAVNPAFGLGNSSPGSVFELGSRDKGDRYSLGGGKQDVFGLGGKPNPAFGLGGKKRR